MESENLSKLTINYLTEEEYATAKANGELKDDELYMTPDDAGFGSVDVYSTEEIKTNKVWTNGKPIYRDIVKFGAISGNTMYQIDYDFSKVDELIEVRGTFVSDEGYISPIDFTLSADTEYAVSVQAWTTTNKLRVWPSSKINISNAFVLLEYTKKSDEKTSDTIQQFSSNLVYEKTLTEETNEIVINGLNLVSDGGTYEVLLETNNTGGLTWLCFQVNGRTDSIFTNKKVVHNSVGEFVVESDASVNYGIMGANAGGSIQNLCRGTISLNQKTLNAIVNTSMANPSNQYFANSTAYNANTPIENVTILKLFNQNNSKFTIGTKIKIFKKTAISLNTIMKQDEVYSTSEQKIGVWIDKKPIYRKVVQTTTPSTTNNWVKKNFISDVDTMVNMYGFLLGVDGRKLPINHSEAGAEFSTTFLNGYIELKTPYTPWLNRPIYITLEYTKTTD